MEWCLQMNEQVVLKAAENATTENCTKISGYLT